MCAGMVVEEPEAIVAVVDADEEHVGATGRRPSAHHSRRAVRPEGAGRVVTTARYGTTGLRVDGGRDGSRIGRPLTHPRTGTQAPKEAPDVAESLQIGRASCRRRADAPGRARA